MSKPRVLISGPPGAGKKSLARSLQHKATVTPVSGTGGASSTDASHVFPLSLDTKYYTAEVDVHIHPSSAFHAPASDVLEGSEAFMFVVDSSSEPTVIDALDRWSEALSSAPPTLLLVLSKSDRGGSSEALRERCFEWSLDNGFEVIDANCTNPSEGDDPREKTGVPRVLEALESTMWSNMTMKPRGGSGNNTEHKQPEITPPVADALPVLPVDAVPVPTVSDDKDTDLAKHMESLLPAAQPTADTQSDPMFEGMLDNLDALMQQIQSARAGAVGMSDDNRREHAAALAMRLAAMFGLEDDGEEGSDHSDDD